jgi:hypothetical protein
VRGRLGPGVAVLVVGPTVTGGMQAVGQRGVIERWVRDGECTGSYTTAGGDGWMVALDRPTSWGSVIGRTGSGIFPASSLMPLDGAAEPEATPTAADKPQTVEA